ADGDVGGHQGQAQELGERQVGLDLVADDPEPAQDPGGVLGDLALVGSKAAEQQLALVPGTVEVAAGQGLAGPGIGQRLGAGEVAPALVQEGPGEVVAQVHVHVDLHLPDLVDDVGEAVEGGQGGVVGGQA